MLCKLLLMVVVKIITIYGKEALLFENGEHKTLSVVKIGEEIIFIKDEDVREAMENDSRKKSRE